MKIILAIFAIACTVAFLALRDGGGTSPEVNALSAQAERSAAAGQTSGEASLPAQNQTSAAIAEQAPAIDQQGAGAGNDLLRAARERLDGCASVTANLRYRIVMFDNELIGTGLYQQTGQGSAQRYRLELKTQLGNELTSLLHVCDGESLWSYRERPAGAAGARLERLDLRRVRAAQGEALQLRPTSPVEELATGGLRKLLEGLQSSFRPIRAEAGYLESAPMWAIELEWKPSVLAKLLSNEPGQASEKAGDVSNQVQLPERIMVYLGHEDLFPRRLEFRRRAKNADVEDRAEQGRAGEYAPAVAVEFIDVKFNEPIDPRQFEYGAASALDVTEAFLRNRGLPIVR